jgi:hypothetical protein
MIGAFAMIGAFEVVQMFIWITQEIPWLEYLALPLFLLALALASAALAD